jgi:hypothetical protein
MTTQKPRRMIVGISVAVVVIALIAVVTVIAVNSSNSNQSNSADSTNSQDSSASSSEGDGAAAGFNWKDKKADPFGRMGYLSAEDDRGQILSTTTRSYATLDDAKRARPEGVVFQATRFSGGWPIPFSTSDGPTGFDGTIPIGYTKSAAGAALAAAAYDTQTSMQISQEEFTRKVWLNKATDDQLAEAKQNSEKAREVRGDEITVDGTSAGHYAVTAFDGDYAQVVVYVTSPSTGRVIADQWELQWSEGMWKLKYIAAMQKFDELPEGVSTW